MSAGKILVYDEAGNYLLKLTGDVRVTLCGTLNRHMETIFGSQVVNGVVVDMLEAECLDSTTLGVLAKLGIHCQREYGINVQVFCYHPSILRTLDCMGFDEIFDIHEGLLSPCGTVSDLAMVTPEVGETRRQVLEAHKILIQLSPKNSDQFTDLIQALESGC
ncbi:MAG: STAS domain-containing protein [Porticoccaceae bacterium]|nr:STAS domain-containing protein [Porticoccaceae bacterium]